MVERIRMIIDTEEEVRLAVKLAATAAGVSSSELVNSILRKALPNEIRDAKKYLPKRKAEGQNE
jgi:hypothetical protein